MFEKIKPFVLIRFYGLKSLKVALSHHLCARIQSCRGDFRSALNSEREAYQIYKLQVKQLQ
jgi:protein TIF31